MLVDFLWTDVSSLLPLFIMFMPTKGMVFCSATSMVNFKIVMARVQLFKKSVGFVDVGHNGQRVIHVSLIERGELVFLFQFFFYRAHERVG